MTHLTSTEEEYLAGRSAEVERIVDNCVAGRLTVIAATPGCGLSSLIEAGLAPALLRQGYITLIFREWDGRSLTAHFKEAIATAVRDQADPLFFVETETLRQLLLRVKLRTGRELAILLDQFEDYLLHHAGTDVSDAFDADLAHGLSVHSARFVIGLHAHILPEIERLHQYVPNLLGNKISLSALPLDAGRALISRAALRSGLEVESTVVDAVVTSPVLQDAAGIHPFFAIRGIERLIEAERRLKSTMVRPVTLENHGGPEKLVLESVDADLAELGKTQTELLFRWCSLFISAESRRVAVSEQKLLEYAGNLNRFGTALLPQLVELGILRQVEMSSGVRYELSRESLIPIIQDWWKRTEATTIARNRALFRKRSLSIAAGLIVAMYLIWLLVPART